MSRQRRLAPFAVMLAIGLLALAASRPTYAQGNLLPTNDRPNPYTRIHPWGELPEGTREWAAVSGAEPGPDGNIYVVHRCFQNSCATRPEPPILEFDPEGSLLGSWGEGMFIFPHGFLVDADGNVWVTDSQGRDGKGHQVFKFDAQGRLLMTLGRPGVAGVLRMRSISRRMSSPLRMGTSL